VGRWPEHAPTARDLLSFADANRGSFWHATTPIEPRPALAGSERADLAIVGAGFSGLWAALAAKEREPGRDVVVLEADVAGEAASGRNGGFYSASLTHGIANGQQRFSDEMPALERLGLENVAGITSDLDRYGIDCDLETVGTLAVAIEPHEVDELAESIEPMRELGHEVEWLDGPDRIQQQLRSPTYLAGLWHKSGEGVLDPGKLVAGLRRAALDAEVTIFENSRVDSLERSGAGVVLRTERGRLEVDRALLATGAHPSPVRRARRYIVPVYDYVLISEPLSRAQLDEIGWTNRQGVSDIGNQFHYYRRVGADRILWGGFDAVYRYGGPIAPELDDYEPTFARLAQNFFHTFPQLEDLRFSHRWGGAIDTCSRFSAFFGEALGGRVVYVTGHTGLGVAASRFGARTALDLLDRRETEATALRYVQTKPMAFPPEPLRSGVVQLTRNRLAAADRNHGHRGPWLKLLDRLGLGFDS